MVTGGPYINEDINRNLILDPGEDTGPISTDCPVGCCPGNCELTPPSSASGALPPTVTTDVNGVANFDLVYLKSSAVWIDAEITASTLVLGTETMSTLEFNLPFAVPDKVILPDSPYGIGTLTIVASAGANGSIDPSGLVPLDYGDDQAFTITPDLGFGVLDVEVDGVSVGPVPDYTFFTVVANHTITATFFRPTIAASAGVNGSIDPSGAVPVDYGSNQTFTITPAPGFTVNSVMVDGALIGLPPLVPDQVYTYDFFIVTGDHTISATFIF